jgi:hypothetical protein
MPAGLKRSGASRYLVPLALPAGQIALAALGSWPMDAKRRISATQGSARFVCKRPVLGSVERSLHEIPTRAVAWGGAPGTRTVRWRRARAAGSRRGRLLQERGMKGEPAGSALADNLASSRRGEARCEMRVDRPLERAGSGRCAAPSALIMAQDLGEMTAFAGKGPILADERRGAP